MIRLLIDENVAEPLVMALSQRLPELQSVTVQEIGKSGTADPILLSWVADEGRVLLTNDKRTIPMFVAERLKSGLPMPGVIVLRPRQARQRVLDDLELLLAGGEAQDFDGQIWYVPV